MMYQLEQELGEQVVIYVHRVKVMTPAGRIGAQSRSNYSRERLGSLEDYVEEISSKYPKLKILKAYSETRQRTRELHYRLR